MGTTADKLNKLLETKQAIKQAIIDKGVDVSDDTVFADYPSKIASIESGSGEGGGGGDPYYEQLFNQRTDNGTNMKYLFHDCTASQLDLSKLDTSNMQQMSYMFYGCNNLTSLDVSNLNTSQVTEMYYLFCGCNSLNEIIGLNNWNTTNVTAMDSTFYNSGVSSLDLTGWNVSNVYTFGSMFSSCNNLAYLNLAGWDTNNVTNMAYMFSYTQSGSLTKIDLSSFNTKKLTNAYGMFNWCVCLQELDIRNFELVHEDGTQAEIWSMLEGCNELHTLRLDNCSNATISKIINESGIPQDQAYINGEYVTRKIYCKAEAAEGLTLPPGWAWEIVEPEEEANPREIIWRTTNTKLYDEDEGALYFNGLCLWCNGSQVPEEDIVVLETDDQGIMTCSYTSDSDITSVQFSDGYPLTEPGLVEVIQLDTSKVTDMGMMFMDCNNLIRIPDLDVSSAENMSLMYYNCTSMTGYADPDKYWNNPNPNLWGMAMCFYGCTNLDNYDEIPEIPWIID